jgi:hypothetical protein
MKIKHKERKVGIFMIIFLNIGLNVANLLAGGIERGGVPRVGEEFHSAIGQGINAISAREVRWTGANGLEGVAYVYFAKESKNAIVAYSTNQVCYLNGKLYSVHIGIQSFSLFVSRPINAAELTTEVAISALENVPRGSSRRKEVNLASLLKPELERHLAQPLFLHSVHLKAEDGGLVVDFESCTLLRGRVFLDGSLNVLTMKLLEADQGGDNASSNTSNNFMSLTTQPPTNNAAK